MIFKLIIILLISVGMAVLDTWLTYKIWRKKVDKDD